MIQSNANRNRRRRVEWNILRAVVVLVATSYLGGIGCASPAPVPKMTPTQIYRVGVPDTLSIRILPDPAIERTVTVRPDGMISVDLIGDVPAAGKTVLEIAKDIERRISKYIRDASATVSVERSLSNSLTILGEVRNPRTFPVERDMRVVEALGVVGGVTQFVAKGKIRVIRTVGGDTVVHRVDIRAIQRGDLTTNIPVQGGDLIVAPPNWLASVGYFLQNILFPFQPIMGNVGGAASIANLATRF